MFKKMLLTLSVLTLFVAGAAVAGDTDWTFYGVGHVSINSLNNGTDSQLGVSSNASRFGFKGTSPINDNLMAFWQFESKIDVVNGEGSLAARNCFVGIKTESAGKLFLGKHDTPFKTLGRKVEMFPDRLGDFRNLTAGWDSREGQLAAWVSPDWTGFNMFVAYQFDQNDADATDAATLFSAMATYEKNEIMVGGAYMSLSGTDAPSALRFAGKYSAEQVELAAHYTNISWTMEGTDGHSTLLGFGANFHANDQWNIKGAYNIQNQWTDGDNMTVNSMTFGVERVFTQNVLAYLQYSGLSYGDNASPYDAVLAGGDVDNGFGGSITPNVTWDDSEVLQNPSGISMGLVVSW